MLVNDKDLKKVNGTRISIIVKKASYPNYNVIFIQSVVYLPKQNMLMVSMVNINDQEENKKKFNLLR